MSPIPSPPSLSYSPSSMESLSGDRTIWMSTCMDEDMERGPLTHDAVVVCRNKWSVVSPTMLSGCVFEATTVALGPEHAAVIYGLPASSYTPTHLHPSLASCPFWEWDSHKRRPGQMQQMRAHGCSRMRTACLRMIIFPLILTRSLEHS
ncbi:hypothetical protein MSAN_01899700 [Mycena sanguinolenta]|uniref:Uncharacterized protein n=1 Tax=Mycena sanguinolenta TaxID=230812 RepID=A0A8H6XRP3_9AGAR|nr:hypothetical protein MSAN_01899700 [Mycena sanguinolenta]